jgi:hypothetical protein
MEKTPLTRVEAYRAWLKQGINDDELNAIRQHLRQERALRRQAFSGPSRKDAELTCKLAAATAATAFANHARGHSTSSMPFLRHDPFDILGRLARQAMRFLQVEIRMQTRI